MADPMYKGRALRELQKGLLVAGAAKALPQTTHGPLFTVAGGRVMITQITGIVTTIIQAQANAVKLIGEPTVGSAVDLCATVDINALEVGGLLSVTGHVADAMLKGNGGGVEGQTRPLIVNAGTIDLNAAASNTGAIQWELTYFPLDDGAAVTAN